MKKNNVETAVKANRILLGLLMFVPGVMKLFVMGPSAVTGMLAGMGFPAAGLFAWVLILAEIASGTAILANYKMKTWTIPPMVILLIAAIATLSMDALPNLLLHLVAVANYWVFYAYSEK